MANKMRKNHDEALQAKVALDAVLKGKKLWRKSLPNMESISTKSGSGDKNS